MDLDDALALAAKHDEGQTDQAGRPYVRHINRVVASVTTGIQRPGGR